MNRWNLIVTQDDDYVGLTVIKLNDDCKYFYYGMDIVDSVAAADWYLGLAKLVDRNDGQNIRNSQVRQ